MTLEGARLLMAEQKAMGRIRLPLTPYCWEIIGKMRDRVRDESLPLTVRLLALHLLLDGEELHGRDFTSDLPDPVPGRMRRVP